MDEKFILVSDIIAIEIIAKGTGVRDKRRLNDEYGYGNWRKLKGIATVKYPTGLQRRVEVHWYEAHGIGRRELKIKVKL